MSDKEEKFDPVDFPEYYNDAKIQPIEYIEDHKFDFYLANVTKYITRAGKKDPSKEVQDLKQAIFYLDRKVKILEGEVGIKEIVRI